MFCKYCGKEVSDYAFVCPHCGGLIGELPNAKTQAQQAKEADHFFGTATNTGAQAATMQPPSKKHVVFAKVSKIISIVSLVFSGIAFFSLALAALGMLAGGLDGHEVWFALYVMGLIYGFACGVITLQLGIVGFVFGRIQKHSMEVANLSKTAFILCLISFVLSLFFFFSPMFFIL